MQLTKETFQVPSPRSLAPFDRRVQGISDCRNSVGIIVRLESKHEPHLSNLPEFAPPRGDVVGNVMCWPPASRIGRRRRCRRWRRPWRSRGDAGWTRWSILLRGSEARTHVAETGQEEEAQVRQWTQEEPLERFRSVQSLRSLDVRSLHTLWSLGRFEGYFLAFLK
jgi:hypothetical protein